MNNLKLFENFNSNPINIEKLKVVAISIMVICAGEYGETYYKESDNHVFMCVGDSNPFNDRLEEFIKDVICNNYNDKKNVKITIENEVYPNGDGWKKWDPRTKEFINWKN